MEDWQEEITVKEQLFFEGRATVKYRSQLHKPLSSELKADHFQLHSYYGIRISKINRISEAAFNAFETVLRLDVKSGLIEAENDQVFYEITPAELIITASVKVAHEQQEGEELLGYFKEVPVAFRSVREKKITVCKEGFPTGNEEQREDGLYKEVYCADCTKKWINTSEPEQEATGVSDIKDRIRDIKDGIRDIEDPEPIKSTGGRGISAGRGIFSGCLTTLGVLAGIGYLLFNVFLFANPGIGLGLLAWLTVAAIIAGIAAIVSFLDRFPKITGGLFGLLGWIARIAVLLLVLNGVLQLLQHGPDRTGEQNADTSQDRSGIETIDPVENDGDQPYRTDKERADSNLNPDSVREKIVVNIAWKSLDGKRYQGSYFVFGNEVQESAERLMRFSPSWLNSYRSIYKQVYSYDSYRMQSLYKMLDSIRDNNRMDRMRFANAVVSMVQSQKYVLIVEPDCNDPDLLQQAAIREMKNNGVRCQGHVPFGLRTSLQFLSDLKGDCDTRTLLLYTILKHYNYDVAIVNSEHYLHSMIGLAGTDIRGSYKVFGSKRYYFWETTNKGFRLGELPRENGQINYWEVILN